MNTVLHLTPHLGGGVGRVLLNYLTHVREDALFRHGVLCLEYANEQATALSKRLGFPLAGGLSANISVLLEAVSAADIVLIHWWNHPLLYALLVRETLPGARVIFWSHVSGYHPPYVFPPAALAYPDWLVFNTPISLDVAEVKALPEARRRGIRVVWATGGVAHCAHLQGKPHAGFNIGYIGTVDYCKLHPSFLKMCSRIAVPDARFVVCGGPSEKELQAESRRYPHAERFVFRGPVEDITTVLPEFDVFGYPLAPYHYGTCEQALAESMAAGVPPVVLSNRTEAYMVKHNETGLVASDEESYVRAVERLYRDPALRRDLSVKARAFARERFSMERMVEAWQRAFEEALQRPKEPSRQWPGRKRGKSVKPYELFLESVAGHEEPFLNLLKADSDGEKAAAGEEVRRLGASCPLWRAKTRGTPGHYSAFFPEDPHLKEWSERLRA